jgi:hypothetical protein
VRLWQEILQAQPAYKDVQQRLIQYQGINKNRHLQTFVMGPSSEFTSLCRKLTVRYFPAATTTLSSIDAHRSEFLDIQTQVRTRQAEEPVLFRYVRSAGITGEPVLRDMDARIKDQRAARGVCMCAGSFSDEAVRFAEAKSIDLVGREQLLNLLKGT